MMGTKEYQNLLASLESHGYDQAFPIYLYEDQIMDGRNRFKACQELGIEPVFLTFEGSYNEALEKSWMLNSSRRQLEKSQRAMIAACEILKTRENDALKKLTIPKAALIHTISERMINDALKVLATNKEIAALIFNGKCNLTQAQIKLDEIERIVQEPFEKDIPFSYETKDNSSSLQSSQPLEQDNIYNVDTQSELDELREKLKECMEEKKLLVSGLAS